MGGKEGEDEEGEEGCWGCKDQDDSDGDVLAAVGSSTSNVSKLGVGNKGR